MGLVWGGLVSGGLGSDLAGATAAFAPPALETVFSTAPTEVEAAEGETSAVAKGASLTEVTGAVAAGVEAGAVGPEVT